MKRFNEMAALLLLLLLTTIGCARADKLDGDYVAAETSPLSLSLRLSESGNGAISGTLAEAGQSVPVSAQRTGDSIRGTIGAGETSLAFAAVVRDQQIVMTIGNGDDTEQLTFVRRDAAGGAAFAGPEAMNSAGQRNVVINGRRLSDAEVAQVEQGLQVRIGDADYWYDPVLGAWGMRGGPAMGLIAAGLNLGGPLRADASGGGTGVYVNGRELHAYDVLALQQITGPIVPGRYFITSQGLAGYEGGPPMWNLAAMTAQAGGGGSNTWQGRVTGASGFSDGTTGAVFLPNGGIVSTGQ